MSKAVQKDKYPKRTWNCNLLWNEPRLKPTKWCMEHNSSTTKYIKSQQQKTTNTEHENIKIKQPATPSQTEITTPKKSKMWTNEMRDPNDLASSKLPCLHHSNSKQTETDPIIAHMQNIQSTNRNFQRLQHKSNDIQAISFVSTSYQNDDALWWKIPEGAPEGRQAGAPGGNVFHHCAWAQISWLWDLHLATSNGLKRRQLSFSSWSQNLFFSKSLHPW